MGTTLLPNLEAAVRELAQRELALDAPYMQEQSHRMNADEQKFLPVHALARKQVPFS